VAGWSGCFRRCGIVWSKNLALAGITTVKAVNGFIRVVYVPAHNARFSAKAEQEASAFAAIPRIDLNEALP
jgi:hypothetical protein